MLKKGTDRSIHGPCRVKDQEVSGGVVSPFFQHVEQIAEPARLNLEECAYLSESDFHLRFWNTAIERAKYAGFLRNVAIAMANSGLERFKEPLRHLASHENAMVAGHARWALGRLEGCGDTESRFS